MFVKLLKL